MNCIVCGKEATVQYFGSSLCSKKTCRKKLDKMMEERMYNKSWSNAFSIAEEFEERARKEEAHDHHHRDDDDDHDQKGPKRKERHVVSIYG